MLFYKRKLIKEYVIGRIYSQHNYQYSFEKNQYYLEENLKYCITFFGF